VAKWQTNYKTHYTDVRGGKIAELKLDVTRGMNQNLQKDRIVGEKVYINFGRWYIKAVVHQGDSMVHQSRDV
jgi:hypothetical protein